MSEQDPRVHGNDFELSAEQVSLVEVGLAVQLGDTERLHGMPEIYVGDQIALTRDLILAQMRQQFRQHGHTITQPFLFPKECAQIVADAIPVGVEFKVDMHKRLTEANPSPDPGKANFINSFSPSVIRPIGEAALDILAPILPK